MTWRQDNIHLGEWDRFNEDLKPGYTYLQDDYGNIRHPSYVPGSTVLSQQSKYMPFDQVGRHQTSSAPGSFLHGGNSLDDHSNTTRCLQFNSPVSTMILVIILSPQPW
jgi:hypothetical protein